MSQPVGEPRRRLVIGLTAVPVVAAAVGVMWVLAGASEDTPVIGADLQAGEAAAEIDQPGAQEPPAAEDAPAGGGRPADDSDTASGSTGSTGSSGADAGGPRADRSSNRPPVVESPGLGSEGLVLFVGPTVSDPDGDDVTLLFDIDGMQVDPAQHAGGLCQIAPTCAIELDFADVGYQRDVPVTIIATDSRGATTRESYSHTVRAITDVRFSGVEYAVADRQACLGSLESRELSYRVTLSGAIEVVDDDSRMLTILTPSGSLGGERLASYVGEQPPPLRVSIQATISDFPRTIFTARPYSSDEQVSVTIARDSPCESRLTFSVAFETK